MAEAEQSPLDFKKELSTSVKSVLEFIDQEREREIIARRFGLNDRRETLEQIGELLGITRERVRQLEKAISIRLRIASEDGKLSSIPNIEKLLIRDLAEHGRASRVQDIALRLIGDKATPIEKARIAFLAELSHKLTLIDENDHYFQAVAISEDGDEKKIKNQIDEIVKTIKKHGTPATVETLHADLNYEHPNQIEALATISKQLSTLKGQWGLNKWPTVNPKNIRDKIFVILSDNGKPMHFSKIAKAIKESDFKRSNVTTQAIHNELIKDKRFVLIGRGIYALAVWGYSRGTVSDIITDVITKAGEPLHRDEIVKRVLKERQVKETTILLNLQSKPQFKRVSKATYDVNEIAK